MSVSLTEGRHEVTCRVPINRWRVEGEFSGARRRGVDELRYDPTADVAVVEVRDQNDVRSEHRVSLAEACVGQGAP